MSRPWVIAIIFDWIEKLDPDSLDQIGERVVARLETLGEANSYYYWAGAGWTERGRRRRLRDGWRRAILPSIVAQIDDEALLYRIQVAARRRLKRVRRRR